MRKIYTISGLLCLVLLLSALKEKELYHRTGADRSSFMPKSSGPPACYANEPPNSENCTTSGCHEDAGLNTGTAEVLLDLGEAENKYTPGETYTITVSVSKSGMKRAGFQCIALMDNDHTTTPGTITLTDANRTQKIDKQHVHGVCEPEQKVWVEHTFAGVTATSGTNQWSFQWKAPDNNAGPVTFYLSALEANNDMFTTGDQVYTLKKTIVSSTASLGQDPVQYAVNIYPNPAREFLQISTGYNDRPQEINLFNVAGQYVTNWRGPQIRWASNGVISLRLDDVRPGTYFLQVKGSNYSAVKELIVTD